MNLRPSGYEPDELPGCSTPRHRWRAARGSPGEFEWSDLRCKSSGGLLHPASLWCSLRERFWGVSPDTQKGPLGPFERRAEGPDK